MKSVEISDDIFASEFYNFDNILKKDLILLIQLSQRAKVVKASKFFVLKLSGFTSVRLISVGIIYYSNTFPYVNISDYSNSIFLSHFGSSLLRPINLVETHQYLKIYNLEKLFFFELLKCLVLISLFGKKLSCFRSKIY